MELSQLTFHEQPELRHPDLVTAFAGWSDAAQAATGTVSYLVKRLSAKRFAEIEAEEFYDFSSLRPTVTVDRGLITSLKLPHSSFFCWQNQTGDRDLVLLHGIEPQLRWMACHALLRKLTKFLEIELDLEELRKAGEYLQDMLSRLLAESDQLRRYVQQLEEQYAAEDTAPREPSEDANRIIREVEDFLRNERHRGEAS